jgi:catechol 2,3-dioxygenase-like lactoylglutathione lyase family enzyme
MPVAGFQHVNTRSVDIERTRDFYVRVLGFRVGERPPFTSRGYWLYLGDQPVLHLVQRPAGERHHEGGGNVDHMGFHAVDLEATRIALKAEGLPFRETIVPRDDSVQISVCDPDGIQVELNFSR